MSSASVRTRFGATIQRDFVQIPERNQSSEEVSSNLAQAFGAHLQGNIMRFCLSDTLFAVVCFAVLLIQGCGESGEKESAPWESALHRCQLPVFVWVPSFQPAFQVR